MESRLTGLALWCMVVVTIGVPDACGAGTEARADTLSLDAFLELVRAHSQTIEINETRWHQARGEALSAAGAFDLDLEGLLSADPFADIAGGWSAAPTYRISMAQRSAGGVNIKPWMGYTPSSPSSIGVSVLGIDVGVSALRLFGRDPAAARYRAANYGASSAQRAYEHAVGAELVRGAILYWEMRAAKERHEVLYDAERRARELNLRIGRLVEAGERPAVDAEQASAFVADRVAQRSEAAQMLWEAAAAMALIARMRVDLVYQTLLVTSVPEAALGPTSGRDAIEALPVARRPDVLAAKHAADAEASLLRMRRVDRLPRVSLSAGYARSVGREIAGAAIDQLTLGFGVALTPQNRAARGALERQRARYAEMRVQHDARVELAESARVVARAAVENAREEMLHAERAERAHRRAVENERQRLSAGFATVVDVMLAEDRLTGALLRRSASKLRHAVALARLALESGQLAGAAHEATNEIANRIMGLDVRRERR